jgi:hypothetical protein
MKSMAWTKVEVIPPFTAVGRALFVKRLDPAKLGIARFSRRGGNPPDPSEMGEKVVEKGPPGRVCDEARASAVIRATDIFLTHAVDRIGPG